MNRKLLVFSILFLVLLIFFVTTIITVRPVLADVNDTVTIDVNVTEVASITVVPDTLNWTNVGTGQMGGVQYLNIKNAGSINVSQISAYMDTLTTESVRPYGSGNPKSYSAGGVITLKNESDSKYYFAGRIEWNWTQDIPNHLWSAVTSPKAWGYFRSTSNDYVWVLGNGTGTSGRCNETGSQFAIEYDVDLGTEATRTPITVGASTGRDATWSYFSVNDASSPLNQYCVAAYYDCSKIYIYHFDKRSGLGGCTNSAYLQSVALVPGSTIILATDAWVPNGYPAGFLNTTILTVYAIST